MNSKKLNFIFIGVIVVLFLLLIFGTSAAKSLLETKANELTDLKAQDMALEEQKIALAKAKKDIEVYSDLEKITRAIVPEDKSQAEAVREIVKIAGQNNISLASITFPSSTLGGAAGAKPSTAKPAPAPKANAKSLSQLEAVPNIPGVYKLTISVNTDPAKPVPYNKIISFLKDLENNRRTAQVSTISLQPDVKNPGNLTLNLTLNGYIKP